MGNVIKQHCYILPLICLGFVLGIIVGGLSKPVEAKEMPEPVVQVYDTLTDWNILQLGIIMKESRFNPDAVGKTNDFGIFHFTSGIITDDHVPVEDEPSAFFCRGRHGRQKQDRRSKGKEGFFQIIFSLRFSAIASNIEGMTLL